MAIAHEASVSTHSTAGVASLSVSVSPSGVDRLLVATVAKAHYSASGNPGTPTWNSETLTHIVSGAHDWHGVHAYRLLAPALTTANLTCSFPPSIFAALAGTVYSGVDQSAPIGATGSASHYWSEHSSAPIPVSASSAADALVHGAISIQGASPITVTGAGGTQVERVSRASTSPNFGFNVATKPGEATTTLSWTENVTEVEGAGLLAFSINPAASDVEIDAEPGAGALSLIGQAPTLAITAQASPELGALALAGRAPSVSASATVSPEAGALALVGQAPAIARTAAPAPAAGALSITGHAPAIGVSEDGVANPGAAALTLEGHAPTVRHSASAAPTPALLTIAGHAVAVQIAITAQPPTGALALTGAAPMIARTASAAPAKATLAIIGNAPVVMIGAGAVASPGAGALEIAGHAPALQRTARAAPAATALTLTGHAPNIHIGADGDVLPAAGALTLTGHAPSVRRSANASPARATLTLSGLAPAIAFTGNAQAQPGAGALTFTGFAPAVNTGQEIAAPAAGRVTITGHPVTLDQTANSRITPHALDEAARIIGEALEINVEREPIGALDEDEDEDGVRLVAALSEGAQTELGYAMGGGYRSFEFEQRAAFELLAVGGDEDQRRARVSRALVAASNAIAANRRLGGLVDHADLEQPDPTDEVRYAALAAVLVLTFTAPTALG